MSPAAVKPPGERGARKRLAEQPMIEQMKWNVVPLRSVFGPSSARVRVIIVLVERSSIYISNNNGINANRCAITPTLHGSCCYDFYVAKTKPRLFSYLFTVQFVSWQLFLWFILLLAFKAQYQRVNSPQSSLYISYGTDWENLLKHQDN